MYFSEAYLHGGVELVRRAPDLRCRSATLQYWGPASAYPNPILIRDIIPESKDPRTTTTITCMICELEKLQMMESISQTRHEEHLSCMVSFLCELCLISYTDADRSLTFSGTTASPYMTLQESDSSVCLFPDQQHACPIHCQLTYFHNSQHSWSI